MPKQTDPPSVAAYFAAKLGRPLVDPQSRTAHDRKQPWSPFSPEFHIETGCGADCRAAIDMAAAFAALVRDSTADADDLAKLIEICESTVLCYVYG
jgi:hypothetical protein